MKQATKQQVDSTEVLRLAAIVESSEDAIVGKDLNGIVETWNAGAEQLYGYAREEMRGRSINLLVPADRVEEEARILRTLQAGQCIRRLQTVRLRKGGDRIDVSLTVSPVFDAAGTIVGAAHVARDMTRSNRYEDALRQIQKLESLGIFAGHVIADFDNLFSGIVKNGGLALRALPEGSPGHAGLGDVMRAAERASTLSRQVLAFAGKERSVVTALDLSDVVTDISCLLEALISRNVRLTLELDGAAPFIDGDAGRLQQLIMNLVLNGAEAIGDASGSVIVRTGEQEVDDVSLQTEAEAWLASGTYALLEVHDTGCGMNEETQAKIFDPFFTTKITGGGLGLAAVRGIVREHGGALRIYSAPGQGSTFRILFPVSAEPMAASARHELPRASHSNGHVLVADDEEMIRTFAKNALEHFGYTVTLASDGQEAIDLFAREPDAFDLVFLDLTMPVMNGEEVFRRLQNLRPGFPVLLSSGFNESSAVRHFADKGRAGFIQKPYSTKDLVDRVKASLSPNGA